MVKKSIELIGTSQRDINEAVRSTVKEAARTLRGIEWIRVIDYTIRFDAEKGMQHQVRLKVFFGVQS